VNSLILIVITLIISAFFSGMEIAYIAANRLQIEIDKKQGHPSSQIISIFINNPGKYLTTMLVGNNIALVIYSLIMTGLLEPVIYRFTNSLGIVLLLQTLLSTLLILFTGEFLPKIIFRSIPNLALNIFSIPVLCFYILFYPLTSLITRISLYIISKFHKFDNPKNTVRQAFNKIDLVHLINQSTEKKPEDNSYENDLKIFQNALDFSSVKVRDCMVPRTEIVAVEMESPVNELREKFIETGFSKILVYTESIDNISGYITSKSLFKKIESIREKVVEISFVPEAMPAHKLLEKFIQDKMNMAVVVDEFGGVSGMLTIEDIIEEIFGEIEDEHDTSELIEKRIGENEFILSGRLEIDYLNDKYNLNLPESEDYETLAGLIFFYFQNIPKHNEIIRIESFDLKILKVSKTRIELVNLKTLAK
jgi:CBS domain containing-hemolysin-like protein